MASIAIPTKAVDATDGIDIKKQHLVTNIKIRWKWDGIPAGDDILEEVNYGDKYLTGFEIVIAKEGDNDNGEIVSALYSANKSIQRSSTGLVIYDDQVDNYFIYEFKQLNLPVSFVSSYDSQTKTFSGSDDNGKLNIWIRAIYPNSTSKWVNEIGIEVGATPEDIFADGKITRKEKIMLKGEYDRIISNYNYYYGSTDINDTGELGKYFLKVDGVGQGNLISKLYGEEYYLICQEYLQKKDLLCKVTTVKGSLYSVIENLNTVSDVPETLQQDLTNYYEVETKISSIVNEFQSLIVEPDALNISNPTDVEIM